MLCFTTSRVDWKAGVPARPSRQETGGTPVLQFETLFMAKSFVDKRVGLPHTRPR
jgi:hypothetical protein